MWNRRSFRFLVIGVLNTIFSYAVYAILLLFGLPYVYANLVALIAGILFSFRTQGTFVFRNREKSLFGRFVLCWAIIYIVNIFLIKALMDFGLNAYVAGAVIIPPLAIASYFTQKLFVFRIHKPQP